VAQRRHHYERAFEAYLRLRRVPYVAVDEARRALLPEVAAPGPRRRKRNGATPAAAEGLSAEVAEALNRAPEPLAPMVGEGRSALKSFDFVLYDSARNLLVDVKGRKVTRRMGGRSSIREALANRRGPGGLAGSAEEPGGPEDPADERALSALEADPGWSLNRRGRLESWVTQDDVDSLRRWEELFGEGFASAFVFVYWCDEQPPDGLFQEVFDFQGRWYALRAITLADYAGAMKTRSARWRTVDLPAEAFERLSQPFASPWIGGEPG
jgi:hypothetical protein